MCQRQATSRAAAGRVLSPIALSEASWGCEGHKVYAHHHERWCALLQAAAAAERLSMEVQAFMEDRKSMQQRESILLDLLMGNLASVAGKPAVKPPSRASSINV